MTPLRQGEVLLVVSSIALLLLITLLLSGIHFGQCTFCANVKTIQLNSATLYSGPVPISPTCSATNSAYFQLAFNNPFSTATNITSLTLKSYDASTFSNTMINTYYLRGSTCTQTSSTHQPGIGANTVTNLTLYFGGQIAFALVKNQTYNYVIEFANGMSISGSLYSQ